MIAAICVLALLSLICLAVFCWENDVADLKKVISELRAENAALKKTLASQQYACKCRKKTYQLPEAP